ncbi:MAG: neuraminidase-like domain-containing protein [Candidatus Cyclobacteriaceae bacterium M3_2C_046]
MKKPSLNISGKLIDQSTKKELKNLQIELWDQKSLTDSPLTSTSSDQAGNFSIQINRTAFSSKPELIFKIFNKDQLIQTVPVKLTSGKPAKNMLIPLDLPQKDVTDPEKDNPNSQWQVKGRITDVNGNPMAAQVSAFQVKLNQQQPLGQAATEQGKYLIVYKPFIPDQSSGCDRPDLLVKAYRNDQLIASSEIFYNVEKITIIDLVAGNEVYKGPSEFQQLEQTLTPCLGDQQPEKLNSENAEYLSNKTGSSLEWIKLYILAFRAADFTQAPAPYFYACFRMQLPYSLNKLVAVDHQAIKQQIFKAIDQNIINESWRKEMDKFFAALKSSALKSALKVEDQSKQTSIGKIFKMAAIPEKLQVDLLDHYLKNLNDTSAFWQAMGKHPELNPFQDKLKLTLKVSALTQHYEPATKAIMALPLFEQSTQISNLTQLNSDDWMKLAKEIGSAPDHIPGEKQEKIMNYARLMEKSIMKAFPTRHIATNIAGNDRYQKSELSQFFKLAPDFSFEGTNITAYVNRLNGSIKDKSVLIRDLQKLQRLYNLAPGIDHYKVMETLDREGLDSSLKVKFYGQKAFINQFGQKLGSRTLASQVFQKASQINATTMNLALQYNDLKSEVMPYVLRSNRSATMKSANQELPDLETLFGGQHFCSCKHCGSVYGAAAYFVDLLSYLSQHYVIDTTASTDQNTVYLEKAPNVYQNGLDLLFERRSDLGHIALNCENTNTVLPYLDIVNEILENAIINTTAAYQTTGTTEELKANPEHIIKSVYDDHLSREIFPFSQPFNLWNEEANVYLEHLDILRYQMIDVFQFKNNTNEPDNQAKYSVQLNLTEQGKNIIMGETTIDGTTYATTDFWGISDLTQLQNVRLFIDKAEISYEQLLQFLQLGFVHDTGTVKVKFAPEAPCNIDQAELAYWEESTGQFRSDPIEEEFFIKAHRFFRFLHKVPWTILELGWMMDAMAVQTISESFIEQAAILLQLQSGLDLEPREVLSWWARLNTQSDQNDPDHRSFYARHFLNKTVFDPREINEESFVFTLNTALNELKNTGNLISDYLNEIAAALNISSSDLLLLTATITTVDDEIDDSLNLDNLSQLFRITSLSKALDISPEEYLLAKKFIVADPFDKTRPEDALSWSEQIRKVQQSGFSFKELQYLLLDEYNSAEGIAPVEERIIGLLTTLQTGLLKIRAEHEVSLDENEMPVDPSGEVCKQKLSLLLDEEDIDEVVAIVEAVDGLTSQHEADAITYLSFLDAEQLISDFDSGDYLTTESRYAYILKELIDYLVDSQSRSFVVQTFSTDLLIDLNTAELLLTELVYSTGYVFDPTDPAYAIDDFLDPSFALYVPEEDEDFELSQFLVQQDTYIILYKSTMFINKFEMNSEDTEWTFLQSPSIGWLDLNAISGAPADVFVAWQKMENFFRVHRQFNQGDITFFNLMDYAGEPSLLDALETGYEEEVEAYIASSGNWVEADKGFLIFLNLLAEVTGWEIESLYFLAGPEAYEMNFDDFIDEETYFHLMHCFEVLEKLGASARDAWSWMAVDLTNENSGNIKQTAKAKYNESEWLKVAAPLRDVLREKQRDALTVYLIQNQGFEDENALYQHFLLDVETSACTLTSRIVLANSSVQLFIQRHLMNLEREIIDLDINRWEWMKNYRVWEANRKVFLYPENWIEPELRLSKSEFFADLQNALLQNNVTDELVENVVKDYLEKLDAVSNIEVCGTYHQYEDEGDDPVDVMHVFGRTISVPYQYYYRTFVDQNYWTPWKKVNLSVRGKHLIPVVINRRLYLFWPEFTEKQEEISPDNDMTYWEIKLAFSEYKNDKWLAQKSSEAYIESDKLNVSLSIEAGSLNLDNYGLHNFCFLTSHHSAYLKIKCIQLLDTGLSTNYQYNEGEFDFYFETYKIKANNKVPVFFGLDNMIKPTGTDIDYMTFKETGSTGLELVYAEVDEDGNYLGNDNLVKLLNATPGSFHMPIPHQYDEFVSQQNFFYADDERSFLVKPYNAFSYKIPDVLNQDASGIDFYLKENAIPLGVFDETIYRLPEIDDLIFDSGPKDELDPVPFSLDTQEKISHQGSEWTTSAVVTSSPASPKLDFALGSADSSLQVNKFHTLLGKKYRFYNFYHPFMINFIKKINVNGVKNLITRDLQFESYEYFSNSYQPTTSVHDSYPRKEIDFSPEGAMSIYNWEMFFHIPMLVADQLSQNQRFEESQKWYHFIFNPLDRSSEASPHKFWQFKPFFELYANGNGSAEDSIYNLLYALSYTGTDPEMLDKKAEVEQQVTTWINSPFDPHAIAALRPVAYMKTVVMKYIDNLISWGDHLFGQDTMESINEATQVYILAAQILGKKPELIPGDEAEERTYNELIAEAGQLDAFSNALVSLENIYASTSLSTGSSAGLEDLPSSLYFCIPNNPDLLTYWETVEDRLFKIRHCMNIEGVVRQLPLFQAPVNPALLVKARAAGLDIGSVLNDLYAPLPYYRYRVMVQKALDFCNEVKSLGNSLLSVLEKKDAEEMTLLRAGHEIKMLEMIKDVKKLQLDEARNSLSALKELKKMTEVRYDYYARIEKLNSKEALNLQKLELAQILQAIGQGYDLAAQYSRLIPETTAGVTPGTTFGGANVGEALNFYGSYYRFLSSIESYQANKAAIQAGHDRRWDEWKLQEKLASRELVQIDKQITAAEIRVEILGKEKHNHETQLKHSREVNDWMNSKFTSKDLYEWMSGQLSSVYFQSYQLAYDMAKKAQKAFQYELNSDQTFIQFGYWDSLKKGLLAGEKLNYDIRRMEAAYLDQNRRTFEINKSISLARLDPLALIQLKENGVCFINLPEVLFDLDYPGQYLRRIKSVQLTIPCVTGPYTSISGKLTLLDHKWRIDTSGDTYTEDSEDYDSRFVYHSGGTQSIATSSGQNDSGLFQLNFNDERFLPFEGAGAISNWKLEFPAMIQAFNYQTISDIIIQISYTAREGGETLKEKTNNEIQTALMEMALGSDNIGLTRMVSLKHEFSNEWYRFLNPLAGQTDQQASLNIASEVFPFMFRNHQVKTNRLALMMVLADQYTEDSYNLKLDLTMPSGSLLKSTVNSSQVDGITLSSRADLGNQLYQVSSDFSEDPGLWELLVQENEIPVELQWEDQGHIRLNKDMVKDLILIFHYQVTID